MVGTATPVEAGFSKEPDLEFSVFFETNQTIDAERFANFLCALAQHARTLTGLPETRIEILELSTGSLFAKLRILISDDAVKVATVLAAGFGALQLMTAMDDPATPVQPTVIVIMANDGVNSVHTQSQNHQVVVSRPVASNENLGGKSVDADHNAVTHQGILRATRDGWLLGIVETHPDGAKTFSTLELVGGSFEIYEDDGATVRVTGYHQGKRKFLVNKVERPFLKPPRM